MAIFTTPLSAGLFSQIVGKFLWGVTSFESCETKQQHEIISIILSRAVGHKGNIEEEKWLVIFKENVDILHAVREEFQPVWIRKWETTWFKMCISNRRSKVATRSKGTKIMRFGAFFKSFYFFTVYVQR